MLAKSVQSIRLRRAVGRKVKANDRCALFPKVQQNTIPEKKSQLMQDSEFIGQNSSYRYQH